MSRLVQRIAGNFRKLVHNIRLKLSKKKHYIPQYILFRDFFRCEKTANLLSFTFLNNLESPANKWLKLNSLIFQFSIILLFLLEVISFVISVKEKLLYEAIDNFFCSGIVFVILLKLYVVFYHNKAKISEIISVLDKHFPYSGVDQISFKVYRYLRVLKLHEKVYYIILIITLLNFSSLPFLHQIYGRIKSVDVEWELILPLKLPFDQHIPIINGSINLIEAWVCTFGVFAIISTDLIFANLLQVLSMELDILGQVINEINIENDKKAIKELKVLVDIHQELIKASEKLEEIFSPLLLFNVFGAIISLCTTSFLVAVKKLFF